MTTDAHGAASEPVRTSILGALMNWLKDPSHIISLIAIVMSLGTLSLNEYRRVKDNRFALISKSYDRYYEMNRLQIDKWHLSHLFATPDQYEKVKSRVQEALGQLDPKKRAEYLIQERATADFIFMFYEQTRAQWAYTQDSDRDYVREVLEYLNGRLLHNPRLVYWWLKSGGGLESSYDAPLKDDWNANVYAKVKAAAGNWCDPSGPFGLGLNDAPPKANCE